MTTSRRQFIGSALAGGAFLIGRSVAFGAAPSKTLSVAIIGCGTMGRGNMDAFLRDRRCRVTAVCDPVSELFDYGYSKRGRGWGGRDAFKRIVDKRYGDTSCKAVRDWREIANDPSIDAVVICTPDHWHALMAIGCMEKGKHVYCQKPMSLGVSEGQQMVAVAKRKGVVFQVGSQQRNASEFRIAAEWIRNGMLGACKECWIGLPGGKGPYWDYANDRRSQKFPAYFGSQEMWDLWQGPAKHWLDDAFIPLIHAPMCWRSNSRTGGGMITDWGAHHVDILHWAIDQERNGPVAVENMTSDLDDDPYLDWAGKYSFDLVYANGFVAHVSNANPNGLRFKGEKGEFYVCRGRLDRPGFLRRWRESDLGEKDVKLYKAAPGHNHESDFIDGILEHRAVATDCEIGHRSISACHIANICERLRLKSLKWDPKAEKFIGNEAANRLLQVPHTNGW